jgi:hypothetical protein
MLAFIGLSIIRSSYKTSSIMTLKRHTDLTPKVTQRIM